MDSRFHDRLRIGRRFGSGEEGKVSIWDIDFLIPRSTEKAKNSDKANEQTLSHNRFLHHDLVPVFITYILVATGDCTITNGILKGHGNNT